MTTTMNKIWMAAGAFALATSAVLVPVAAQAAPSDNTDSSAVGSSAGTPTPKRAQRGSKNRAQAAAPAGAQSADPSSAPAAGATGSFPILQNPLIWIGQQNLDAPPATISKTFTPLSSLPGWMLAGNRYGWFQDLNFEACVLGLGATIGSPTTIVGPYGTSTSGFSTGGC